MEKERFLVEVTVKGEKDWKAIHMCGSMADAVPVADAVHNLSYLLDTPIAIRVREVKRELEQSDGHMAGIGQQLKLSEEARDARNAGRRLEDENDETDLIGTVKKLEDLIAEQRRSNERIAREMRGMVSEMKDVLEKVEELRNGAADAQHQANQMALMGVANAQQKAGEMTIKNVEEVTARSRKVIDSMVEESKRRIERLSMVTLPDRLFYYIKWMAVILVLIILVHVLWGMLV